VSSSALGDDGKIRVMLVDDHALVRLGLTTILSEAAGIEVVGECADGSEVLTRASEVQPDVVLMDYRMPLVSGTDATRQLLDTYPSIRVVMLTASGAGANVGKAVDAGAVGYILKDGDPALLVRAVRAVAQGGTVWPAA
jgi:DNA-binding NarL/FixJ family response regulator